MIQIESVVLEGAGVRLEPLTHEHHDEQHAAGEWPDVKRHLQLRLSRHR